MNESSIIRPILPADDPSDGDTVGQSLVMGVGKQKAAAGVGGGRFASPRKLRCKILSWKR